MNRIQTTPELAASPFASAAGECLRAAQAAWLDLLADAGLGGARATEVSRRLGVEKTLAWKIARFTEDTDPVSAAKHMPGAGGVDIILKAAAGAGVQERWVEAARSADRQLREFVRLHAGDRRSFEAMLAGGGRDDRLILEERRAHYRSGSAIWGVRARHQFLVIMLKPSDADPDVLDAIAITGLADLERLRPDVPWILRRLRASNDSGSQMYQVRRTPLDPDAPDASNFPILPEYCTHPLPALRQFQGPDGWIYHELSPGPVGRGGAVTCVSGEIFHAAIPARRSEENKTGQYSLTIRTPVESATLDIVLHERLSHFIEPSVHLFGLLEGRPYSGGAHPNASELCEPSAPISLGSPPHLQTARTPGYPDMIRNALERAGWPALEQFRAHRSDVEFPPFPCDITMIFQIAER